MDAIQAAPEHDREALGQMIAAYLAANPRTDVSEDEVAKLAASPISEPPVAWPELLPALRHETGTTRTALVQKLAAAIGFPKDTAQVEEHVHNLETGKLPAAGVSTTVVAALAKILGVKTALLEAGQHLMPDGSVGSSAEVAYLRKAPRTLQARQAARRPEEPTRNPMVDSLFGVERG